MRILFISNFYPPARAGGYTQWCHEVALGLADKGHEIAVLTSNFNRDAVDTVAEKNIFRLLHLEGDLVYYQVSRFFTHWQKNLQENLHNTAEIIQRIQPDLIFIWGMWAMSKAVAMQAEQQMPKRVVYFLSDYWPADSDMHQRYWDLPVNNPFMSLPKKILGALAKRRLAAQPPVQLNFDHAITVSKAVRDILVNAGIPLEDAKVIHGGTDLRRFPTIKQKRMAPNASLKLLYAGQMVAHKGVHTILEAINQLKSSFPPEQFHLLLVGSGHPDYEQELKEYVHEHHLEPYLSFKSNVTKDLMPLILDQSDVLIFPSVYEEPFARMTQEAMLAGLAVVGTTTGGTKEILFENETGLTFPKEDAGALASQLERMLTDRGLCRRLAANGQQYVLDNFTLPIMIGKIEQYLIEIVATETFIATETA